MSKLLKKKQLNKKIKNFTINLGLNLKRSFSAKAYWCEVCKCYKTQTVLNGSAVLGCVERNSKLNIIKQNLITKHQPLIVDKKKIIIENENGILKWLVAISTFGLTFENLKLQKEKQNHIINQDLIKNKRDTQSDVIKANKLKFKQDLELERIRLAATCPGYNESTSDLKPKVIVVTVENNTKKDFDRYNDLNNKLVLARYSDFYVFGWHMLSLYFLTITYPFLAGSILFIVGVYNLYNLIIK